MMLSPSAARLGTSIRLKGKSIPFRHLSVGGKRRCYDGLTSTSSVVTMPTKASSRFLNVIQVSDTTRYPRYKSTASVLDYDNDDTSRTVTSNTLGLSYMGHAAAAEYRVQQQQQLQVNTVTDTTSTTVNPVATTILASESWRINLGRGNDNAWLMGPRNDKEWFTGIAPNQNCPGNVSACCIDAMSFDLCRASESLIDACVISHSMYFSFLIHRHSLVE